MKPGFLKAREKALPGAIMVSREGTKTRRVGTVKVFREVTK